VNTLSSDDSLSQNEESVQIPSLEKLRNFLVGVTIGDALGSITEHLTYSKIQQLFRYGGPELSPEFFIIGDDTQLIFSVVRALARNKTNSLEEFMEEFQFQVEHWLAGINQYLAPDQASANGFRPWLQGKHWSQTGVTIEVGSSLASRVLPIGWFYNSRPGRIKVYARALASASHNDPIALNGAQVIAFMSKFAYDNLPVEEWKKQLLYELDVSPKIIKIIEKAEKYSKLSKNYPDDHSLMFSLGRGSRITEIIGLVWFIMQKYYDSFWSAVYRAVRFQGRSDTLATIVGGLQGLRIGLNEVPNDKISFVIEITNLEHIILEFEE